jgi:hypothetical protein
MRKEGEVGAEFLGPAPFRPFRGSSRIGHSVTSGSTDSAVPLTSFGRRRQAPPRAFARIRRQHGCHRANESMSKG